MRTKSPLEDRILPMIEPISKDLGFDIVRLRVMGGSGRKRLQIMAERPDGSMGVDDCANLSRSISAILDVEDPFDGAWELEVSSPGVDRPLTALEHFARWEGFEARLELDRLVEGRKRFSGVLAGVEGEAVLLDPPDEDATLSIPFDWIAEARLVLTDELIAESLRRGSAQSSDALGDDVERELDQPEDPTANQTNAGAEER